MEINTQNATLPAPPSLAPAGSREISSDFETFLKMLTAQMQNQDPLNPIESTDYATQLATFSSVEQQVKTNDLLSNLSQQMGEGGLAKIAGWVGMQARVSAPVFFGGQPVTLYPEISTNSDAATLIVRDEQGNKVMQQAIPPDGSPIDWVAADANGNPLPIGIYSLSVENYAAGNLGATTKVETYATVNEARLDNGGLIVVLPGGIQANASDVTALRSTGL